MTRGRGPRAGVTLLELLFAAAILAGAMVVAYGWLQQDYAYGMDLVGRETADTLVRNMLERYRHLTPDQMLEMLGEEGEVDPGAVGDATLDRVDPRGSPQLEALGHRRGVRLIRRGGPLGGVSLVGRATWRTVGGRTDQFEFGVARLPLGAADTPQPSGLHRRAELPEWGRATRWSVRPPSSGEAPGAPGVPGGNPAPPPDPTVRHAAGKGPRLPRLVAEAAQRVRDQYLPDSALPPEAPPQLELPPDQRERLFGAEGLVPRSYREALERLRQQRHQARRAEDFFQRTVQAVRAPLGRQEIPEGEYTYTLEALDRRQETAAQVVGVYRLRQGPRGLPLVARRAGGDPPRRLLAGDEVLEWRSLRDGAGLPWLLARTEDRLFLIERRRSLGERHLLVAALTPDGSPAGTTMTRRAVDGLLEARRLRDAAEAHPDPLLEALAQGGG